MRTLSKSLIAASIALMSSVCVADSLVGQSYDMSNASNHAVKLKNGKVVQDFEVSQNLNAVQTQVQEKHDHNTLTPEYISSLAPAGSLGGQAAIDFLTVPQLKKLASDQGVEVDYLKEQLLNDPSVLVTKEGEIIVVEPSTTATGNGAIASSAATIQPNNTPYTGSDVFKLHSRPGSKKILYMDFNGFVTENDGWGVNNYPHQLQNNLLKILVP